MSAVFKREFKAYFSTPIGFLVLGAYFFFLGLYFTLVYSAGSPDVTAVIMATSSIVVFTIPIITMRLISEDRRQKVDQALLTAPVKLLSIVLGKYFAALALFAIGFAPTLIFELIVATYVKVNFMSYLYSLIGVLLLGSAFIAIGMFISSLTESSVVAAILTYIINFLILYLSTFSSLVEVKWVAAILEKAAIMTVFENFSQNIFSIADIIYFLSITAAFIFLTVRSLEKRRWS